MIFSPKKMANRTRGFVVAVGLLASLATLASCFGRWWWGFELATHFRVHYLLILGGAALALALWRSWRWPLLFGALALFNLALIAPIHENQAAATAVDSSRPVPRALLANVNAWNRNPEPLRRLIAASDPDFILLLEATPWLLAQLRPLAARYPHQVAEPAEDPFGIALLSRHPLQNPRIVRLDGAAGPPAIVATVAANPRPFTVIGAHPWPPVSADLAQGRNDLLRALAAIARQTPGPTLLLGDLNVSPWSPWFAQLLTDGQLRDSRRGWDLRGSWPSGWWPLRIPIDHILVSEGVTVRRREIGPAIGSDHDPVIVDFQVSSP